MMGFWYKHSLEFFFLWMNLYNIYKVSILKLYTNGLKSSFGIVDLLNLFSYYVTLFLGNKAPKS